MNPIYCLTIPRHGEKPYKLHIDLGKIVSVSEAVFVDRMGHGGYFASAEILVQLRDAPIEISTQQEWDFDGKEEQLHRSTVPRKTPEGVPTRVHELQTILDDLRKAWREYTEFMRIGLPGW